MASKINIFDEVQLQKILEILQNEEFNLGPLNTLYVLKLYPFEDLVQIPGLNHDIICYNAEIIGHFFPIDDFLRTQNSLERSVNFIITNLNFLLKQKNSGKATFVLLNLFRKLLSRLNLTSRFIVSFDSICNMMNCVLQSCHVTDTEIKSCVCNIVLDLLRCKNFKFDDRASFIKCINSLLLTFQNDLVLGFQIVIEMVEARDMINLTKVEGIYTYTELSIKQITEESDQSTIFHFLKCLSMVWKYCENINYIKKYFDEAIHKLPLIKLWILGEDEQIGTYGFDVLALVINHEFKHIALESDYLRNTYELLKKSTSWDQADSDLAFFIYYLELMYLGMRHDDRIIVPKVTKTLIRNFPKTPALMKVMCFLYGAYAVQARSNNELGKEILRRFEDFELRSVVTFHFSQLLWMLTKGRHFLKIKVLKLWLELHENRSEIVVCMKATGSLPLLVEILSDSDDYVRIHALLRQINDPDINGLLVASIAKPIPDHNFAACLLKMKGVVRDDVQLAVFVSRQLLTIMPRIQDLELMKHACYYILDLFAKNPNHVSVPYMQTGILQMFLRISKADDDELGILGVTVLRAIMQLQIEVDICANTTIEVDLSTLLKGSDNRVENAVSLVKAVIRQETDTPLLGMQMPSFSTYHQLLGLSNTTCKKQVYRTLVYMMRKQPFLAASMHNTYWVISECQKKDTVEAGFLHFLMNWLRLARSNRFYRFPNHDIMRYLGNLDDSYENIVLLITGLLNKCQPLPTTTATTNGSYFS